MASVLTLRFRLMTPLAVALFASLCPLLLAACGGTRSASSATRSTPQPIGAPPGAIGPPSRADLDTVRRAAANTLTQKVVVAVNASPGTPTWPVVKGSGSFDLRRATGKVVVQNPHGFESVVFEPAGVFDRPAPDGARSLPKGRPWIRADYDDGLTLDGAPPFLLACESADIGFFLAEAAWGARTAAPLGRRVVNHVPATGYLVHIDLARAAAAATGPRAQGFVRIARLLQRIGWRGGRMSHRTVRVWVDRSGRVVAVRASLPLSGIGDAAMTITRFGARAVHPVSPPQKQVVDLAALIAAGDDDD